MPTPINPPNALITGASSGLGQAMARALTQAGMDLALHYHSNRAAVADLAAELGEAGRQVVLVQGDLSTREGVRQVCQEAETGLGRVDVLVNNAGEWVEKPLLETSDQEWDALLHTDLRSTYLACRSLAPPMAERGWGRIVNISSVASLGYVPGEGLYGIAKAGINMLTKSLGVELADRGVTVNAVAPAWTVPANEPFPEPEDYPQCSQVPDKRPGHAREVAALVAFLISDAAAHITGQILPIDGGLSAMLVKGR